MSGLLIFGGINGFNVFNPGDIKEHSAKPKTVITDFKVFNKSVKVNDVKLGDVLLNKSIEYTNHIELKHNHNAFSFLSLRLYIILILNRINSDINWKTGTKIGCWQTHKDAMSLILILRREIIFLD